MLVSRLLLHVIYGCIECREYLKGHDLLCRGWQERKTFCKTNRSTVLSKFHVHYNLFFFWTVFIQLSRKSNSGGTDETVVVIKKILKVKK